VTGPASLPPVVAVVGPTATGKTALAVALAQRLGGEVVNADSMQLYRGMDIGTAKPDLAERGGVPHHLLDLWHVREPASVAEYRQRARAEVDRLRVAGALPLLVGGSGLYVRAVLDELDFPGTDPAVRARLEAELAERGPGPMHARLAEVDPAAAAAVLPSNGRRIVRALEVVELTGAPFRASLPEPRPHYPAVVVGLDRDAAELDERIARRVDRMWAAGFVAEVAELAADGLREGPTASRALGYAQVLAQLDGGLTAAEARERTVATTRRFVRRQRSWFRRDATTIWFDAARPDLVDAVGELLAARTIGA
jgi:tRNA dimethylallyltransferase